MAAERAITSCATQCTSLFWNGVPREVTQLSLLRLSAPHSQYPASSPRPTPRTAARLPFATERTSWAYLTSMRATLKSCTMRTSS
eukprot:3932614-Pleurochrysis_carterae.AAC.1